CLLLLPRSSSRRPRRRRSRSPRCLRSRPRRRRSLQRRLRRSCCRPRNSRRTPDTPGTPKLGTAWLRSLR
ncbi:MAG: hypothetical protein DYH12_19795, partial [Sorangiineae bacterium PRO1]|nr:hypothetical protein [Sorangiineae bacterium PRO1]